MNDFRKLKDVLKPYEILYIRELNEQCVIYKTIGAGTSESPAWFVFDGLDYESNKIKFFNSQKRGINFSIDIVDLTDIPYFEELEYREDISSFFRELKYSYLHSQHPTIETPMRPNRH